MILSTTFQTYLQGKITCRHRWLRMMAFLLEGHLSRHTLEALRQRRDPNPVALKCQEIACSAIQAPPVNPLGGKSQPNPTS